MNRRRAILKRDLETLNSFVFFKHLGQRINQDDPSSRMLKNTNWHVTLGHLSNSSVHGNHQSLLCEDMLKPHLSNCIFVSPMQSRKQTGKGKSQLSLHMPQTVLCEGQYHVSRWPNTCFYVGSMKTVNSM